MNHQFPGWPGHVFNGRRHGVAPVTQPVHPGIASLPYQAPSGADAAAQAPQSSGSANPPPHLAGMAAYGVPLQQTPGGHSALIGGGLQAGLPPGPPNIPGMPQMPAPQSWFPESGGLFQTVTPVTPFDRTSQIRRQS